MDICQGAFDLDMRRKPQASAAVAVSLGIFNRSLVAGSSPVVPAIHSK
jgi:hypothetical protein